MRTSARGVSLPAIEQWQALLGGGARRSAGWAVAAAVMASIAIAGRVASQPAPGSSPDPCPTSAASHDFQAKRFLNCNFSGWDLTDADFRGARLQNVAFVRTNLAGAKFDGATIESNVGDPALLSSFVFANLAGASFNGATFVNPIYFSYAALTCADFSATAIGNAIFSEEPLIFDRTSSCRLKFREVKMTCDFVNDWNYFDLTGADVSACKGEFNGHDFSGAILSGVSFAGLDLTGSKWAGAVLEGANFQGATLDNATGLAGTTATPSRLSGATFNKASARNVDFSNAQLYGADFTEADVSNSSFAGAFLTSNAATNIPTAAKFTRAHLKNVNLANARLQSVNFSYASLYGSFGGGAPAFPCQTDTARQCPTSKTGFTCGCATAAGADLTQANFSNAFLYGVDFGGKTTTVNGTLFSSAILTGASFEAAQFQVNGGAPPDFSNAMLQGASLGANSNLVDTPLTGAFVDFGARSNTYQGNILYVLLSADYTRFRNWAGAAAPCVQTTYAAFTVAPTNVSMTCPNGSKAVCGAGVAAPQVNPNWAAGAPIGANTPVAGWYLADATYDRAASQSAICKNGAQVEPNW